MTMSKLYTTDGKVRWFANEDDVNTKLISILGEKFETYRKKWDLVNLFELETEFPLFLQVETNQICNLKCPACPIGVPEAYDKYISQDKMSWEMYEKIILEAEKYNCPSIEPQGTNEPLLDQNLEKYIKFASDHGFLDIMMNTNATVLTKSRSRSMLKSGITRLRFSLDAASKETYEKVRVGGNYETTINNIENFLKIRKDENYQLPIVGVNFCKTSYNEHEEEKFVETWIDKVDFIVIQEFQPPELENSYAEFLPSTSKYREKILSEFHCQQPWQRVVITNKGEICPCCAFFRTELSLGNINNSSIYEIWNSNEAKKLRQIHKDGNFQENEWCKRCVNGICGIFDKNDTLLQIGNNNLK